MFLVGRDGEPGDYTKNKAFVTMAGQFSAGGIVAAARAMVFQRCIPCGRTLILQQIQRIVSAGTPDLNAGFIRQDVQLCGLAAA